MANERSSVLILLSLCKACIAFVVSGLPSVQLTAQSKKPIPVLIVDGFSNHDWKQTTILMTTVVRAIEWLATGKTSYPFPGNFPAKDSSSLNSSDEFISTCINHKNSNTKNQ